VLSLVRARVDVEVWGDLAESAAAELGKGVQVQARALAGSPGCLPAPRLTALWIGCTAGRPALQQPSAVGGEQAYGAAPDAHGTLCAINTSTFACVMHRMAWALQPRSAPGGARNVQPAGRRAAASEHARPLPAAAGRGGMRPGVKQHGRSEEGV